MEPLDVIDDIKTKIQHHVNIASNKQRLVFNGALLVDGKSLKDYNIQKGSTFRLATCLHDTSIEIDVKTSNGESFMLSLPETTVSSATSK